MYQRITTLRRFFVFAVFLLLLLVPLAANITSESALAQGDSLQSPGVRSAQPTGREDCPCPAKVSPKQTSTPQPYRPTDPPSRVTRPSSEDVHWDDRFGTFGVDGRVHAVEVSGGDIYIGGTLHSVAGTPVYNIARWDGSRWDDLGSGVNGTVNTIAISGTHVYVGGHFNAAGGVDVGDGLAMWDGSQWSSMGGGISGGYFTYVDSIAILGDDVYVGGMFTHAGGTAANNVARWDGTQWHDMAGGVDRPPEESYYGRWVADLAVVGDDLYVGGSFSLAGGSPTRNIAKWDGAKWSTLGSGLDSSVSALDASGTDLYVGGNFLSAGGTPARGVARWTGSQWSALGSGITDESFSILDIKAEGDCVYVAGAFSMAGDVAANNIARWDGSQWYTLGTGAENGTSGRADALAQVGDRLLVGGNFNLAGGVVVGKLGWWNGSVWSRVSTSSVEGLFGGIAHALAVFDGSVYVGGEFRRAGTSLARGVARWDGNGWSTVGNSTSGTDYVKALAATTTDLYIGGSFFEVDGVEAHGVARWDGSQWHPLGSGVSPSYPRVYALAATGTNVYSGGWFTTTGGTSANNIARWDGNEWHSLGEGYSNGVSGTVYSVAISGTDVYVGGDFTYGGGMYVNGIIRWDGSQWHPLGSGVASPAGASVRAILIDGNDVYVGGRFNTAGGQPASNVARWDGSNWHPVGEGMPGEAYDVRSLARGEGGLYAGGNFPNNIARWDGISWQTFGSGTYGPPLALVTLGRDLYAAGEFDEAGAKPSFNFGIWHEPSGAPPTPTPLPCSAGQFADTTACSTFYNYVTCLVDRDVVSGYPCGTRPDEPCDSDSRPYFRPGAPVTRGQLSKIVALAASLEEVIPPARQTYADVAPGSPFWQYIESLSSRGVMGGYACGGPGEPCDGDSRPYFRPGANISRGQTAKIVSNTAGYDEPIAKCQQTFADTPASGEGSTFWEYIERLSGRSVMSGYSCGGVDQLCDSDSRPYFRPGDSVTRGQSSKIVANTFYPGCQPVDGPVAVGR